MSESWRERERESKRSIGNEKDARDEKKKKSKCSYRCSSTEMIPTVSCVVGKAGRKDGRKER